MHDDFNAYRAELDRLRLTPESKRALTASLVRRQSTQQRRSPRRLTGTLRLAAVIAAIVCLLGTVGYAAVTGTPTLLGGLFDGGAAYEQSSAFIGRSVESGGWAVTVTDCVGDDYHLYIGLEATAPEGTVLPEEEYHFDRNVKFYGTLGGQSWSMQQLPDADPTDNRVAFLLDINSMFGGMNGQRMRLSLSDLYYTQWNDETEELDHVSVCSGKWDFGRMTISYPDSIIRLEPNVPVTTLGVDAVITELTVSPVSVYVRIEGDALKGHHAWVPKNAPDGWYGCIEYQEIILHFDDGTSLTIDQDNSDLSGSGCSGGTDTSEDGWLALLRTYGKNTISRGSKLIDVERVTSVSVCGVDIPLR